MICGDKKSRLAVILMRGVDLRITHQVIVMKHLIQSLIISIAVIGIASPSFADGDREDKGRDRDKKEQSHHSKKDKQHGNPFNKIVEQLDELNYKLDELLAKDVDLRGVTQNWDKELDSTNGDTNGCNSDRFTCIRPTDEHPDGVAVRDNETGLVWPRFVTLERFEWGAAIEHCARQEVASRFGWHLPRREQLASLIDNSATGPIPLPDGHPFVGLRPTNLWTATVEVERSVDSAPRAWVVVTAPPPDGHMHIQSITPGDRNTVFCVRGGQTYDGQDVQRVIEALPLP